LFPCVSQVRICSFRPPTPPFALTFATCSCAAAKAGVSKGFMAPVLSNAQPMMIGGFACLLWCPDVAASALPITTNASSPTAANAHLPRTFI
jgi:hypothetical protein